MDDMAWTTPRNDTSSCRLSDCLFHNFHSSLQHQFSMFHRFFMRRRDRLAEPLAFPHLLEEFSSGLFSQVLPFEISAWVRRVRCRSLARSLPPLKLKKPTEETSGVFGTRIGKKTCAPLRGSPLRGLQFAVESLVSKGNNGLLHFLDRPAKTNHSGKRVFYYTRRQMFS